MIEINIDGRDPAEVAEDIRAAWAEHGKGSVTLVVDGMSISAARMLALAGAEPPTPLTLDHRLGGIEPPHAPWIGGDTSATAAAMKRARKADRPRWRQ